VVGLALIGIVATAFGGGIWLGRVSVPAAPPPATGREVLYYQAADGSAAYSPTPQQDAQGRPYLPVYAEAAAPAPTPAATPVKPGRVLYYRNPMGLADVSPVPKKDPMGMEYVPVYEGEDGDDGTVRVSPDRVQMLGVRSEAAALRPLAQPIRAVGTVAIDERGLHVITAKFEGYIERLHVDQTGQAIRRGQTLFEVYSPDLVLAEEEYRAARRGAEALAGADAAARDAARGLAEAALIRLRNWDIGPAQLDRLRAGGAAARTLTLTAPASGVVLEKRAVQGMRFLPGDELYRIADLSRVWVIAELPEQDLARVALGQPARVSFPALPGRSFTGTVGFLSPTLGADTRTARVRIELANPGGLLRPALYGTVEIAAMVGNGPVLSVPESAVLDSGGGALVLVERGDGLYQPRPITTGARGGGFVEIRSGLAAGEKVVTSANFLIDSESNLRAALTSFHPAAVETPR